MTDDELRELSKEASAGPWGAVQISTTPVPQWRVISSEYVIANVAHLGPDQLLTRPDTLFIAAAREAVPELLDRVASLKAKLDEAELWLSRFANDSEAYRMGEEAGLAIRSLANQQQAEALAEKMVTMSQHQSYGTVIYRVSICGEVINGISDRSAADHHLSRLRWKIAQLLAREMEAKAKGVMECSS